MPQLLGALALELRSRYRVNRAVPLERAFGSPLSSGAGAPAMDTRALALGRNRVCGALLSAQGRGGGVALAILEPKAEQDSPPRSPPAGASHDRLLDHAWPLGPAWGERGRVTAHDWLLLIGREARDDLLGRDRTLQPAVA